MQINQNHNLKGNVAANIDPANKIVAGSPPAPYLHQTDPFKFKDIITAFLSCCNIPEIKTMSVINRTFKIMTESETQWKDIGDTYFETPLATKQQIKNYILITKQQAHECFDSSELSISLKKKLEKLYNSERIQDIKLLRSLCKARDTLMVWDALKVSLGGNRDFHIANFNSIAEVCTQATGFPIWFEQNYNQLKIIQKINLQENNLTYLPPQICELSGLRDLDLRGNQLTALPPEIGNLSGLQQLDLSYNEFTELPSEIGNLSGLRDLDLGWNQLTALPPEIGNLSGLLQLDLSNNQLTELPSEMGKLIRLQQLSLSLNKLTALSSEIGNLIGLQELYLSYNQLTALPSEMGNLIGLQELYLSYNQLTALPSEMGNLTGLQQLSFSENKLTALPSEIGNLIRMQALRLSENKLTALPSEVGNLIALQHLDLSKNQLSVLPSEMGNLIGLQELFLSSNQLTALPSEIGNLSGLQQLDLSYNQLTTVPLELKNLQWVNLEQNPLDIKIYQAIGKIIDDADISTLEYLIAMNLNTAEKIHELAIEAGSIDVVKWLYRRGAVTPKLQINNH